VDLWLIWLVVAVGLAVGEMLTTSFYLAPFAGGALVAALLAGVGLGAAVSVPAFLVVSVLLLTTLRPIARRHVSMPARIRTGTDRLVGTTAVVLEEVHNDAGTGQVRIDGDVWTARAYDEDEHFPAGARVQVIEIRGATALIAE
jgi:membrane protein implicated in regulation of membrane protease activity